MFAEIYGEETRTDIWNSTGWGVMQYIVRVRGKGGQVIWQKLAYGGAISTLPKAT